MVLPWKLIFLSVTVCLPYMHSFVWTCLCVWMCTWSLCRCIHTMTILSSSNVCDVSFYFVIHCVCVDAHVCSGAHFILWDVCCVGICFSCCTVFTLCRGWLAREKDSSLNMETRVMMMTRKVSNQVCGYTFRVFSLSSSFVISCFVGVLIMECFRKV